MTNLAQAASPGPGGASDAMPLVFMLLIIGVLFYFVILRPQRTEQKKRDEMLSVVGKGDHIVTVGGIHGTVEGVDVTKNIVSISVAPKTTIRVNKSALASVTPRKKVGAESEEKS